MRIDYQERFPFAVTSTTGSGRGVHPFCDYLRMLDDLINTDYDKKGWKVLMIFFWKARDAQGFAPSPIPIHKPSSTAYDVIYKSLATYFVFSSKSLFALFLWAGINCAKRSFTSSRSLRSFPKGLTKWKLYEFPSCRTVWSCILELPSGLILCTRDKKTVYNLCHIRVQYKNRDDVR